MQKQVTVQTKHGVKTFIVKSVKPSHIGIGNEWVKVREYQITDSTEQILGLMSVPDHFPTSAGVCVNGYILSYGTIKSIGTAKTHDAMFARIIRKVAKRAI